MAQGTGAPKLQRDAALRVDSVVAIGTLLDGKYRVESVLGHGGMGVVVAAKHEALGRRVAIKIVRPTGEVGSSYVQRALREARAAAAVRGEHAARVLDVGQLDSGAPYLVMELLEGENLSSRLAREGALPVADVALMLLQASEVIAEAHSLGIVHRDLKPSNLFLTLRPDGSPLVKLMDFGIAKVLDAEPEETLTTTNENLGTIRYMSPEQLIDPRSVDTRSDVWALGALTYRLLTGKVPFEGESGAAVAIAIASKSAPRLRDSLPEAPPALDELVARCLAKSRLDRLQSVAEFAAALLPFVDPASRKRYAHVASSGAETPAPWNGTRHPEKGRGGLRRAGLGVLMVAIAAGTSIVIASRRPAANPSPSTSVGATTPLLPEPAGPSSTAVADIPSPSFSPSPSAATSASIRTPPPTGPPAHVVVPRRAHTAAPPVDPYSERR